MTKMQYIMSVADTLGRRGMLCQCPACHRVVFTNMADKWCEACSDEGIPTNRRMTL
jgi:hypothetical protein